MLQRAFIIFYRSLLAILALVVVSGTVYLYHWHHPSLQPSPPDDKYRAYHNPSALMSPAQVHSLLAKGHDIALIDVRPMTDFLSRGHIENALQIWRPDIIEAGSDANPYGGMRASREKIAQLLGRLGINDRTLIIPYDARGNSDASRFWWLLTLYGHPNVALMDGGLQSWMRADLPITHDLPNTPETTHYSFTVKENLNSLALLEDTQQALNNPNVRILDTRSLVEFRGDKRSKGAFRAGHIPGAQLLEHTQSLNQDMTFKTADELKVVFDNAGIDKNTQVIAYCQSGVRSAHTRFVMAELLGYDNIKNYDGSWIEWSWHQNLPIETSKTKEQAICVQMSIDKRGPHP